MQKKGFIKSLFTVAVAVSICIAQNVNISGTVTDTGGTAIAGADVKLEKGGISTTTGADGSFTLTGIIGINDQINQSIPYKLYVTIHNGLLYINIAEKSPVEIITYTLQGKVVSSIKEIMDAGAHSIAQPHMGAGVYLYKVRSGSSELIIKSLSIGKISSGTSASIHGSSSTAIAGHTISYDPINDVIAVMKDGYLNYRVIVTNSDTSGIEIKMIVCEGIVIGADGYVYQTVRIGNQVWTVENLRTTKYNDGSLIPHITDSTEWTNDTLGAYCFYKNTTNADSIKKFGALYNWYAVDTKKLAPTGWHIPDTVEWNTLENYLIANGYNWDGTTSGNKIAKAMAAKTDWISSDTEGTPGNDKQSNNSSGFSGLPGGCRFEDKGQFEWFGAYGKWWSATERDSSWAYDRNIGWEYNNLQRYPSEKGDGLSVRFVKD